MNKSLSTADAFFPEGRHPLTAALLSVFPGLGQLYVGDRRKGILFIDVTIANAVLLLVMLFTQPIIKMLEGMGNSFHFRPNDAFMAALSQAHVGSPASLLLLAMMIGFTLYAARDAYDLAFKARRRKIYPDVVVEFSEATSGSYLAHIAMIFALGILAMFFIVPQHRPQITSVTFIDLEQFQKPIKKPVTETVSSHANEGHAVHKTRPQASSAASSASSSSSSSRSSSSSSSAKPAAPAKQEDAARSPANPLPRQETAPPVKAPPRTIMNQPVTTPVPTPNRIVHQTMAPNPTPAPLTAQQFAPNRTPTLQTSAPLLTMNNVPAPSFLRSQSGSTMPVMPTSPMTGSSASGAQALQTPKLPSASGGTLFGLPTGTPGPGGSAAANRASFSPLPGTGIGTGHGHAVTPQIMNVGTGGTGGGSVGADAGPTALAKIGPADNGNGIGPKGNGNAPKPTRSLGNGRNGDLISITPNVGTGSNKDAKGHDRDNGDDKADGRNGGPVTADIDFGPYMAMLQRRIKSHWFPPKDSQSKRVLCTFDVTKDGQLSNLKLARSTGNALADNAALKAVEESSPLPPLPAGSPNSVSIEFTFDYNVFAGDGSNWSKLH